MKKMYYYLVVVNLNFYKIRLGSTYDSNSDPSPTYLLVHREIYGLEKSADESDDSFFQNLKKSLTTAIEVYADDWCKKNTFEESGFYWDNNIIDIQNISYIGSGSGS